MVATVTPPRCRGCGRYGAGPITRTVRDWRGRWHTIRQTLCPDCAKDWSQDFPWNQPADFSLPVEER